MLAHVVCRRFSPYVQQRVPHLPELRFAALLRFRRASDANRKVITMTDAASCGDLPRLKEASFVGVPAGGLDRFSIIDGQRMTPLEAALRGGHQDCADFMRAVSVGWKDCGTINPSQVLLAMVRRGDVTGAQAYIGVMGASTLLSWNRRVFHAFKVRYGSLARQVRCAHSPTD